jgi:hypothetical protein
MLASGTDSVADSSAPVSADDMFQDLPWFHETTDNTEHYIERGIRVT